MIKQASSIQNEFLKNKTSSERKELGQYFTDELTANYMASMIDDTGASSIRILDAGAGAGILTIAAALRYLEIGKKHIHVVLYELDNKVIPLLKQNMIDLSQAFLTEGSKFTYEIKNDDFVLSRPDKLGLKYHLSIINPPYFKYSSKNSRYTNITADLFKGNPNIYASFMAIAASSLEFNGQMIAIVPRSFKNGLYFKGFRHFINGNLSLDKIHTFNTRNSVFKNSSVLQEVIICSYTKCRQSEYIKICNSRDSKDIYNKKCNEYPTSLIIDRSNDQQIIRIPENRADAEILSIVETWPSSFSEMGYFISTGPVVEHRTREYITTSDDLSDSVPLLRMHNVQDFKVLWSGRHKKDGRFKLIGSYEKHVILNRPYLLLKRFSSKEEKSRLKAAIYIPNKIDSKFIAIENHLNYIGIKDSSIELTELYGLAIIFNSTFMDRYFRCISGSTQVNVTEIRLIKIPSRSLIRKIGEQVITMNEFTQENIDMVFDKYLNIKR